jgi:hypothetical protein
MNFLISGKLGDFIHQLYVVKYYSYNNEINLYYSPNFLEGLDYNGSFNNLKLLVDRQSYINSFDYFNDQLIDVNLTDFRYNKKINTLGWTDLLIDTYGIKKLDSLSWIDTDKNLDYNNKIIIHRSQQKHNVNFPWGKIIDKYKKDIIFISIDENDYNSFPYKNDISFVKVDNIYELSIIINSCKLFIGNQSMPFALSHSLNIPRIVEISEMNHFFWYVHELKYYDNLNYYYNDQLVKITLID